MGLRYGQFGGKLLLQLVRAKRLAGGLVSIWFGGPANEGLSDRCRYPARTARGFLLQENGFDDLRIQSGPWQPDVGLFCGREFLSYVPRHHHFHRACPFPRPISSTPFRSATTPT